MPTNNSISVMTWNIYLGADLTPLTLATQESLPQTVTEIFRQVLATNFKVRSKAIAASISNYEPDIIALQDIAKWKIIPPNSKSIEINFLAILLEELKYLGLYYEPIVINNNFTGELPSSLGNSISVLNRDVILVNKDSDICVIDNKRGRFNNNMNIDIGGVQYISLRGWEYIDICFNYIKFRIINTHLEEYSDSVNIAQVNEIIDGPANINIPVILLGSFNSDINGITYNILAEAGFKDTWILGGLGNGFTCYQDNDLLNAYSTLNKREDMILVSDTKVFNILKNVMVGNKQCDRTKTGLWTSTHAGVISKICVKKSSLKVGFNNKKN